MKTCACIIVTAAFVLAGCQTPFPNENPHAYGATVRATLASQIVAPVAHPDAGADGAAAVAAYGNYQRSYTAPVAQSDSAAFGRK